LGGICRTGLRDQLGAKALAKRILPPDLRMWLRAQYHRFSVRPPVGAVHLGSLNRTRPISGVFGFDRGQQIDRYYIEAFLSRHAQDIKGVVLEVAEDTYTRRFGGSHVLRSEVLHREQGHPGVTIVADLAASTTSLGCEVFDCIILTQTLQFIYDLRAALASVYHALRPGGVLLATVPGISQISRFDMDRWGDYWRFTELSARRLVGEQFPATSVEVSGHGNVFAAISLLHGLAQEDVDTRKLDAVDPDYPVVLTIRAVRTNADAR
jgi:SAM-dependent methyltransferase